MKQITFLFLFLLPVSLGFGQNKYLSFASGEKTYEGEITEPVRFVKNQLAFGVEIEYNFTGATISERIKDNTKYNFIHIDKFAKTSYVGAPALPVNTDIIALPKGAIPKLTILSTEYYEYSGYMIHPALKPATGVAGDKEPEFEIDSILYSKNEFYPKNISTVRQIQHSRGTPLAYISIIPVQFNPVTKTIRVYTNIKYRIDFEGGAESFDDIGQTNSMHYTDMLRSNVLNYKSIPNSVINLSDETKAGEKEYIIITHSEYINAANDLADWKRQLGYSVELVSQSSWTTAQIKAAIADRYNAWTVKPDYFVIIGDHTGSYALPGEIYQPPGAPNEDFATDLYYSCMDGGGDYFPDMAHGRISVRTAAESQIVIDKIIKYEKDPPVNASFYSTATHCAQFQVLNDDHAERRFCQTAEESLLYVAGLPNGYSVNRVYAMANNPPGTPRFYNDGYYSNGEAIPTYLLASNGFAWDGDKNDIASEINDGRFYLLHRDHGYTGGVGWYVPEFLTTDIPSMLSNGDELPVVFSMNCHTGEFQLDNCFGEQFIRMENGGAVGVIGAAYWSISGYNDALTIGMFDAVWPGFEPNFTGTGHTGTPPYPNYPEIFTMGDVMNQGLLRMTQSWGDSWGYEQYEYELFHWFGDPAMKIWTANPHSNTITATHPTSVDCAGTTFVITNSTAEANATLVYNNELIGEVVLDGSGNGTINYSITAPGTSVILTVSKHNCVIYTVDLPLSGTCSFPPAVITNPAGTVTISSAELNGEITDDFGDAVTESGFVYSTSSNPLIGGGGVTQILTSPVVTTGVFNESIIGLSSSTTYYYKAYAINANGTSYGDEISFSTLCGINTTYPFTEDFEGGSTPDCWTNEYVTGTQDWAYQDGGQTVPASAHGGIYNAIFYNASVDNVTKLITPQLDMSSLSTASLTFWRTQDKNQGGRQDELRIYYKNSTAGSWNLLATYVDDISVWQQETITLTDLTNDYYIAFEGTADQGKGVCIDDVNIDGTPSVVTVTWDGSESSDWQTGLNWDSGTVPTSGENVLIPNGMPNYPVINNGIALIAVCNNITVENSASLTVDIDGYITVSGSVTNNAGTSGLLINSDTNGTGSLIQNTSGGIDATVQLYFDASPVQWHMLSSPINNAVLSVFPTTNNLYFYDETTDDYWTGNTYGSGSISGWTAPVGNLNNTAGYLWYYYQTTLNFVGQLNDNTSSNSIDISYTDYEVIGGNGEPINYNNMDGWNFIGNPYTSAIDWTVADAAAANLYDAIYFYDGISYSSWVNGSDSWDAASTNGGSEFIPAMQGFYVKGNIALGEGGTLNIPENARVHSDQAFRKNGNKETPKDFLRIAVEADGYTDETIVRFLNSASFDMDDKMDAYKRFSWNDAVPQIYTNASNETEYSINSIPYFENSLRIPVKFKNTGESFSINITEFNFTDMKVYLRDNYLNETIEIGLNDSFKLTANENDDINRFELIFEKSTVSVPQASNTSVILFPNPNSGIFYLTVGNNASDYTVEVTNITGQIVYKNTFEDNFTKEINMKSQSSGVYFVKIKFSDNSVVNKKIIVE